MTRDEFIAHEIAVWGEDYIFGLFERGFEARLTNRGWYWFQGEPTVAPNNAGESASRVRVG